jgi:hypothetical protein
MLPSGGKRRRCRSPPIKGGSNRLGNDPPSSSKRPNVPLSKGRSKRQLNAPPFSSRQPNVPLSKGHSNGPLNALPSSSRQPNVLLSKGHSNRQLYVLRPIDVRFAGIPDNHHATDEEGPHFYRVRVNAYASVQ